MAKRNRFPAAGEQSKIENYEEAKADGFKGWLIHHRLETHDSDGVLRLVELSPAELNALGMYYNRPASELIYMKKGEHSSLHHKGKRFSDETRAKMREAWKHRAPESDETRAKRSVAHQHPSDEAREHMREGQLGRRHSAATKAKMSAAQRGHKVTEETKLKISLALKGKRHLEESNKGANINEED